MSVSTSSATSSSHPDTFHSAATLHSGSQTVQYFNLQALGGEGVRLERLPFFAADSA